MATEFDGNARRTRAVERDDLVHTGPGTSAGAYLRRFWQPVHVSAELPEGRIVPIRILGEDLALYRGESGTPRLMTNERRGRLPPRRHPAIAERFRHVDLAHPVRSCQTNAA